MNLAERLMAELDRKRRSIIVCGDAMTDVYVHGRLEESCQERCHKFIELERTTVPGGAGNAARSLEGWKTSVNFCGADQRPIPTKTRLMVNGECIFRLDHDTIRNYEYERSAVMRVLLSDVAIGGVLLSDYDKGVLTEEFIRDVARICKERRIPCVADCKRPPVLYTGCILKCNAEYQEKYHEVMEPSMGWCSGKLVITGGHRNPLIWQDGGPQGLGYDLPAVKCVNHVGAGDCFAAHLTLALAHGFSLKDAAALAHSAGRVYVQYPHNSPPQPPEIMQDLATAK